MSYWKACVSSWPITWFRSPSVPPVGSTIRRRSASVTPPVPSPIAADGVGLLELRRARVENERLPAVRDRDRSTGDSRAYQRSAIRPAMSRRLSLVGVEVDVEVLGLEHAPVEAFVLDLVAAEVLRLRGGAVDRSDPAMRMPVTIAEEPEEDGINHFCAVGRWRTTSVILV